MNRTVPTAQEALALLDAVLPRTGAQPAEDQEQQLQRRLGSLGAFMPATMGVGTVTKGCPHCGGTAISNYETDEDGNIINQGPYICANCGRMS